MRIAGLITPPDGVNVEGEAHTRSAISAPEPTQSILPLPRPTQGRDPLGFLPVHRVPQVQVQPGECASQRWRLGQASEPWDSACVAVAVIPGNTRAHVVDGPRLILVHHGRTPPGCDVPCAAVVRPVARRAVRSSATSQPQGLPQR